MNAPFTKHGWRGAAPSAMAAVMAKPPPRAGGFFLGLLIVLGLIGGIAIGSPITGVVIGTVIGIAVALLVWIGEIRKPRL